jgi:hypothetical protein
MEEQFYVLDTIDACGLRLCAGGQCVNVRRQRCLVCGVPTETSEPPEIEIKLNHLGRHGFAEHLWNSHSLPIFRQDLIERWQGAALTGFELKPVRIVGWYEKPRKPLPGNIPTYYRLVTTSKVRLVEPPPLGDPCPKCGSIQYAFPKLGTHLPNGVSIDPASWDGSDFFGLAHYVFIFCTRRAATVTLEAGYNKHIAFVRAEDWSRWEEFDFREWTPEAHWQHVQSFLIRRVGDL